MNPAGATFSWENTIGHSSRLLAAIGVSVLAHLLIFQLFLVLGPEHANSPAPAPELTFLSPDVPEHRALLESIRAQFPTAALSHPKLSSERWMKHSFHPSYHWPQTEPLLPKLSPSPATPPPLAPKLPLENAASTARGQLLLSPALRTRAPHLSQLPSFPSLPAGQSRIEAPRFWVAVQPSGEVAHVFLESSSGQPETDRNTEAFLRQLHFVPTPQSKALEWGQAALQEPNSTQ